MKTCTRELALFFTLLLVCPSGHAAEQDNWYLANEWEVNHSSGVAYHVDNTSGNGHIYVANRITSSGSTSRISVFELNGSIVRHIDIANARRDVSDITLDDNGTIYIAEDYAVTCLENNGTFKWRTGKGNPSISNYGSWGSGDGEFNYPHGIVFHHSTGEIFVADKSNRRIQVLDKNGNFLRKFGSQGTAPGQFYELKNLAVDFEGKIHAADRRRISVFNPDGTFLRRYPEQSNTSDWEYVSISKGGLLISHQGHVYNLEMSYIGDLPFDDDARTQFTPEGDIIESYDNKIRIWKRAYRTKGLPVRNVIPQPAVRAITQRAGTNTIDLDFEIIDPDDANATVGVVAYCGGQNIVPQTWVDGTGSKIGTPIATNQVHRLSWNVKPDWPDSTGTLKFEIICHDARRTSPVDLHFITLPLPDGNLTISRSPLKDSDFESYAKFLLTTGQAQFESNASKVVVIPKVETNATQIYTFTNAGATGRNGPTPAQLVTEYNGTNLQGSVTTGFQPGYQKWTVPATGTYVIEAVGARGGKQPSKEGGYGAYMRGNFNLSGGQELTIVVGQAGSDNSSADNGAAGGGGTFVVTDTNNTPLIVAGGGGGAGGQTHGSHASVSTSGMNGSPSNGGKNGSGGQGQRGAGGSGFFSRGTSNYNNAYAGKSFQGGATGGNSGSGDHGGFGGGGGHESASWDNGGGGGGYSGGGGSGSSSNNERGGGGGSYNSGNYQLNSSSSGDDHGYVRIFRAEGINPGRPKIILLNSSLSGSQYSLLEVLGNGYRYATPEEVQKASEAATAGGVNQWTANRPVQPRNLPNKVNEYGFDTGDHGDRAWWVVQE